MAAIDARHAVEHRNMSGVLHGVGLGPGDPELLTLRAHRLIRDAHVITYPAPLNGESFGRGTQRIFEHGFPISTLLGFASYSRPDRLSLIFPKENSLPEYSIQLLAFPHLLNLLSRI